MEIQPAVFGAPEDAWRDEEAEGYGDHKVDEGRGLQNSEDS